MGRHGERDLMAGALQCMASSGKAREPLSIGAQVVGGSVPVNVDGASGSSLALPGGGSRQFTAGASGGVPPYSYTWLRQDEADAKTTLESPSGNTAYILWAGLAIGEYASTTAACRVTDATGAKATSRTIVIGVTRVS